MLAIGFLFGLGFDTGRKSRCSAAVSVVVAVVIGGLETLNLIGDQLGLTDRGGFWDAIGDINDNFGVFGYVIIGIFVLS